MRCQKICKPALNSAFGHVPHTSLRRSADSAPRWLSSSSKRSCGCFSRRRRLSGGCWSGNSKPRCIATLSLCLVEEPTLRNRDPLIVILTIAASRQSRVRWHRDVCALTGENRRGACLYRLIFHASQLAALHAHHSRGHLPP